MQTPEYQAWRNMLTRCYNPNTRYYKYYGGRDISVCEEWQESFESFLGSVGYRPTSEHSLGRKDNNGNYEPGNVCWETPEEQQGNRRKRWKRPTIGDLYCGNPRRQVYAAIRGSDTPLTPTQISLATGIPTQYVGSLLWRMCAKKEIVKVGRGKYLSPNH